MRETMQRRSSAEIFSPLQEPGDMKWLGCGTEKRQARDHATAIISRDLLTATGARRHERVRVVARRRDTRETRQRRSSAETFSLLEEQGDMRELGLWHEEETCERPCNGDHQPRSSHRYRSKET